MNHEIDTDCRHISDWNDIRYDGKIFKIMKKNGEKKKKTTKKWNKWDKFEIITIKLLENEWKYWKMNESNEKEDIKLQNEIESSRKVTNMIGQ